MFLTLFLLAVLYLGFVTVLWSSGLSTGSVFIIVAITLGIQYYFSDRLVLLSAGAREVSPQEAPELHAIVERLAQLADVPKPRVAIIHTPIPNAFATGRSPSHAAVAVTTGLLQRLNQQELEGVIAHEISHIRHRDMAIMTLASFFATVAALIVRWFYWFGVPADGRDRDREGNAALLVYLVSLLVWVISFFLTNALSRYREFAADRGAAILTGAPSYLASALLKISGVMERIPTRDLRAAEGLNAFFIIPVISGHAVVEWFSTHPSLERRLAQLRRLEQEMGRLAR
ncbi:MAG: zinc metalloprotease HtpX [Limnochordales bacterium]|nr:zinc metalloprotease HtpX [Limnochordales bacterium]